MTIEEILFQANPANRDPRQRTILVAIDKSANSHYAFLWAMEHLIKPETDLVILLHVNPVVETPEPCLSRTTFVDFSHYIAEMEEQLRQKAHGLLTSHAHALMDRKIHVKAVVMRGDAAAEICRKAAELNANCLVMGSRGLGPFRSAWMGSVSSYCTTHAPCTCVVIRLPSDAEAMRDSE